MAASEPACRAPLWLLAPLLLTGGLACASGGAGRDQPVAPEAPASVQEPMSPESGEPPSAVDEPVPAAEGESEGEEASEATAPEKAPPHKASDVVVITEGKAATEESIGLYEAAQRARRERGEAPLSGTSSLVITNETLEQSPGGGRISFGDTRESVAAAEVPAAVPEPAEEAEGGEVEEGQAEEGEAKEGEAGAEGAVADEGAAAVEPAARSLEERNPELYWRTRVREARLLWREAVEKVEELQGLAEQLRYDFYATDDPWLRDSSIKPAWDRTLVDLEEARQEVDFRQRTVEAILNEGRRSGALPGWLREGLELEPDESGPRRPHAFDEHDAIEPVEVEEDEPGEGR